MNRSSLGWAGAVAFLAAVSSCILVVGNEDYVECKGEEMTPCNGACVDTSSNAEHCGDCGESCNGGTCKNGECSPGDASPGDASPSDASPSDASPD